MLEEKVDNSQNVQTNVENMPPFKRIPGYKDWLYRGTLFLIGLIGLMAIEVFVGIVLLIVNPEFEIEESPLYLSGVNITNTISYLIIFGVLLALLFPRWKKILSYFKDWKTDLIGLIAGALLILLSAGYLNVISSITDPGTNANQEIAVNLIKAYPVTSIFVLGIIGPVCEELTYRYGLFSMIGKKNKILAYIITILVFAFIHFDFTGNMRIELLNLPSYLIAGGLLCYVYHRYGLNASIIAHVVNNVFSIVITLAE